jgi:hypothetical protein
MVVQRTAFTSVRYQIAVLREMLVIYIFLFLTVFNTFASITINNDFENLHCLRFIQRPNKRKQYGAPG